MTQPSSYSINNWYFFLVSCNNFPFSTYIICNFTSLTGSESKIFNTNFDNFMLRFIIGDQLNPNNN